MVYVTLCMCVCVIVSVYVCLKNVSPSSKGRIFALFFINSLAPIPSQTQTDFLALSFRVRIPTFWVKNVEFIDIGNIGFFGRVWLLHFNGLRERGAAHEGKIVCGRTW